MIAKEIQVPKVLLEDFIAGSRTPPPKVLQDLTTFIFGGAAIFDPVIDRLRSSNRNQPTPIGIHPPRFVPPKVDYVVGGLNGIGPQPVKPEKPKAETVRPGWAR
ncbi:hypothetical protein [Bradyrhizobium elkanii]|uniref:hypothetical protein n=1 Tax=Bradyrhizobium elkanii TaxID=29448 RepID=UPI00155A18D9|nr:hypothetical protein [Bradyrhizobium elkanii]MCS3576547.1 hypothetical protein [Bradyrhizobium elkanii]MCS3719436.1 hypothetical protein [Bradyrhizobium elkanii]MCS4003841.1 hypothetical protein [Bradyrhizobium elkanii USDA 61]